MDCSAASQGCGGKELQRSFCNTNWLDFGYRNKGPIEPVFHSHTRYEVYYFHEGACTYLIGDRIYTLSPGDLILMNGMTLHCPKIDPNAPYVRSVIHFDPSSLQPFLDLPHAIPFLQPFHKFANYLLPLRGGEKEEAERLLAVMKRHGAEDGDVGRWRMQLAFVDLLVFIYHRCLQPLQEMPGLPSEKERTVQRIVSYLEERYADDLHMDQLQADLHVSKFYLSRLFKQVTGVTIFDFVFRRRINQAKILFLLDPGISVTDVSLQTGFKHLAHFSRVFKSQVGVAPEQYRKQLRNGREGGMVDRG